ncbi:MAG: DUF2161 family putative PD-(D/E)XK-type phosphodiesterase [Bacillota bacterium]|nr:DUF2161 family putative PD-(D/E)XK-type phosphodiesterase [Bacillota bacterium]
MDKKKKQFREEDMYKPVQEYFTQLGYDVKSEVKNCDITAVQGEELIIVEMKKSLNLEVIIQASLRQRLTDKVYIAVPKPGRELFSKRWENICYLLRRLEIGLILVTLRNEMDTVDVLFEPAAFNRERSIKSSSKEKKKLVKELENRHGDYNTGGSTRKKLVTAYKEMAVHIACCLEIYGPLSPKNLINLGADKEKTGTILYQNYYGWFDRLQKGLYSLNEKGKKGIGEFPELKDYYLNLVQKNQEK